MADVKLPPGTKVYLGDVKNMYTNIDHVNLNEVIRWVLNLARKNLGHDLSIFVPNAKSKRPCLADEAKAGVPGSKISLDNIEEIVKWVSDGRSPSGRSCLPRNPREWRR